MLSERQRMAERKTFVNICLSLIEEDSVRGVAHRTKLSESTIRRLIKGKVSRRTWHGTIEQLADAAGIRLVMDKDSVTVEIAQEK